MFAKNSRYNGLETVETKDRAGRPVKAVKLRHLPPTEGQETVVRDGDQLDVISADRYKDPTRYWHIADANSELEADEMVRTTGRTIKVPPR